MAVDDSRGEFDLAASGPVLTPQLRAEIQGIMRRAPDGFEHGVGFRLREQGLTDTEIIQQERRNWHVPTLAEQPGQIAERSPTDVEVRGAGHLLRLP